VSIYLHRGLVPPTDPVLLASSSTLDVPSPFFIVRRTQSNITRPLENFPLHPLFYPPTDGSEPSCTICGVFLDVGLLCPTPRLLLLSVPFTCSYRRCVTTSPFNLSAFLPGHRGFRFADLTCPNESDFHHLFRPFVQALSVAHICAFNT